MDKDRLIQRLMGTFVGELEDHVRALEQNLLALEKDPAPAVRSELFSTLFRTAHSLKGSARSVRIDLIETAGHRLEEIFAAARDGRLSVDGAFFGLLLPIVDAITEAAQRLRRGGDLSGSSLEEAVRRLAMVTTSERPGAQPMAPAQPAAIPRTAPTRPWSGTVRVPAEKLDMLLRQSGELLTVRHRAEARTEHASQLQDSIGEWRKDWRVLEQGIAMLLRRDAEPTVNSTTRNEVKPRAGLRRQVEHAVNRSKDSLWRLERTVQRLVADVGTDRRVIEQTASPLDAEVRRARMLPFAEACEGLERMVRDLTAGSEKQVTLVIEGGEIELDRSVLEGLRDPLLHLVRNSIDHGVEFRAARRAAGKPDGGRIGVAAALRGSRVQITISDDGRGLDLDAIGEQLRKKALPIPDDEQDLVQSIFLPGFSTSPVVTHLSGRGVGLDIVKTNLASMQGTVEVSFQRGQGTRFTLSVPLTLTSIRAILIGAGNHVFAIDTVSVHRALRIGVADIRSIEGREVLLLSGVPVPVVSLTDALGLPGRSVLASGDKRPVVILASGGRLAAFVVDTLQAEREVMIRALGPRLRQVKHVAGGTILPDGRVALILNVANLVARAAALPSAGVAASMTAAPRSSRKRLLVVDNSATIRALQRSILEAAGYDIMVAADGAEAWQALLEQGADLVVSDVEMPRMDGFMLTEAIRGSKRFRDLPVILVTALESEADKARGLAVGADAYCLKSAFDQKDLLAVIAQIL